MLKERDVINQERKRTIQQSYQDFKSHPQNVFTEKDIRSGLTVRAAISKDIRAHTAELKKRKKEKRAEAMLK